MTCRVSNRKVALRAFARLAFVSPENKRREGTVHRCSRIVSENSFAIPHPRAGPRDGADDRRGDGRRYRDGPTDARDFDVWGARAAAGLHASALCQSRCPHRGAHRDGGGRFLRQSQPAYPAGLRPLAAALPRLRVAHGPVLGRTLRALRPSRRIGGDRSESHVGGIHPPPRGAVLRRQPGDGGGRDLVLRDARHRGASPLPERLDPRRVHRGDGRAVRPADLHRGRPGACADHGAAADPQGRAMGGRRLHRKRARPRSRSPPRPT
jgi:hypothetical protein